LIIGAVPRDDAYLNSVDGVTYVASTSWHAHEPATRRPDDPTRKVNMEMVWLLTSERLVCERTTSADIAAFLREAERLADESFRNSGMPFRVRVQFSCAPDGHKIQMKHQGGTPELLQAYYDALVGAKTLPVRHDEVSFQVEFSVRT
jgi:hypothetical protein